MYRIVQISDQLFWGFNRIVCLTDFTNFNDLIQYMINELIIFLKEHNLLNLVDSAKTLKLHNHHFKLYEETCKTDKDTIIYLCGGHCE
jgi:hypothetical protein